MQAGALEKELELQRLNGQLEQSTEDLNQYRENDPETYKAMGGVGWGMYVGGHFCLQHLFKHYHAVCPLYTMFNQVQGTETEDISLPSPLKLYSRARNLTHHCFFIVHS